MSLVTFGLWSYLKLEVVFYIEDPNDNRGHSEAYHKSCMSSTKNCAQKSYFFQRTFGNRCIFKRHALDYEFRNQILIERNLEAVRHGCVTCGIMLSHCPIFLMVPTRFYVELRQSCWYQVYTSSHPIYITCTHTPQDLQWARNDQAFQVSHDTNEEITLRHLQSLPHPRLHLRM